MINPVFAEVPDSIYGKHYITVEISDVTTREDKKSAVLLRGFKFYKESVPTVYVNIDEDIVTIAEMNNDEVHKTNCYSEITISVPDGYQSGYGDKDAAEATNGTYKLEYIRGRGNSTWMTDKKPYKIKLDQKADLFGMGANKHWALIANYYDNSLIRNRITYYLGQSLGFEYSPRLVPVDVVMNGNYLGSYYLSEVVRIDENRVDIPDLEDLKPADIEDEFLWFERMKSDPEFVEEVKKAWETLRPAVLEMIQNGGLIDQYKNELEKAAENNFDIPGITAFPFGGRGDSENGGEEDGYSDGYMIPEEMICADYTQEIDRLKEWISTRLDWFDEYIEKFQDDVNLATVSFYDGDTLLDSYIPVQSYITRMPKAPEKEGYTFVGWFGEVPVYDYSDGEEGGVDAGATGDVESGADNEDDGEMNYVMEERQFYPGSNVAGSLVLTAKYEKTDDLVLPEDISVFSDTIDLNYYDSTYVPYDVFPIGADERVLYEIGDIDIIRMNDEGYICACGVAGSTTLTIKTLGGIEKVITVNVYGEDDPLPEPDMIGFENDEISLEKDTTVRPKLDIYPKEAALSQYIIINGNPEIAWMSDAGTVYAYERGQAVITVMKKDNSAVYATLHVTVTDRQTEEAEANAKAEKEKKQNEAAEKQAKELAQKDQLIREKDGQIRNYETEGKRKDEMLRAAREAASQPDASAILTKDTIFTSGNVRYKVTKPCVIKDGKIEGGTLEVCGPADGFKKKMTKLTIPGTVVMNKNSFTVTKIGKAAFLKCKKLKKVTIEANVTRIGAKAFYGCGKLADITITGNKLSAGKNAFGGISKKAVAYVNADRFKGLRNALVTAGMKKKSVKRITK